MIRRFQFSNGDILEAVQFTEENYELLAKFVWGEEYYNSTIDGYLYHHTESNKNEAVEYLRNRALRNGFQISLGGISTNEKAITGVWLREGNFVFKSNYSLVESKFPIYFEFDKSSIHRLKEVL